MDSENGFTDGLTDPLITDCIPRVWTAARRIRRGLPRNITLDDLAGAGFLALVESREKYDATHIGNASFWTFSQSRVYGAMRDYLRSLDSAPRRLRAAGKRFDRAFYALAARVGSADSETVAAAVGLPLGAYLDRLAELERHKGASADEPIYTNIAGTAPDQMAELLIREHMELLTAAMRRIREAYAPYLYPLPVAVAVGLTAHGGLPECEALPELPTMKDWCRRLLAESVRRNGGIRAAAKAVGMGETTAYQWAKEMGASC